MNNLQFNIPKTNKNIIKVIGVGGGGGNAVKYMKNTGIVGVDFAICNTDEQAMEMNPIEVKIPLGPNLTEGRGAGSRPETGKEACIESIDEIRKFLADGTKMLFVTAGMGGGTGTGAAPIIAKAAKEMGILTVAIVTLPFQFEGFRRKRQAAEGLDSLKKNVDAILVISNDKLKEIYGDLELSVAFNNADSILSVAAKSIAEIITIPGYINVDFEDVNYVMKESGVALMGYGEAEGATRAREAVNMAINSPLLEDSDIRGAKHILLNISSGTKGVTMSEIDEITNYIQEEAGYGTDLIWGNCYDKSLGEKLSVTVIATGFETGVSKDARKEEKSVSVNLDGDEMSTIVGIDFFDSYDNKNATTIDFDSDELIAAKEQIFHTPHVVSKKTQEEQNKMMELEAARRAAARKATLSLDSAENREQVEKVPAYKRRGIVMDNDDSPLPPNVRANIATSVYVDSEGTVTQTGNSFLRERID
jgi:cell division protein FtsZ